MGDGRALGVADEQHLLLGAGGELAVDQLRVALVPGRTDFFHFFRPGRLIAPAPGPLPGAQCHDRTGVEILTRLNR